jgi:hypothetical protein
MLFQNFGHLGGFLKNQFQDVLINFISIQNFGNLKNLDVEKVSRENFPRCSKTF